MMRWVLIVAAALLVSGCAGKANTPGPLPAAVAPAKVVGIGNASFAFSPLNGVPDKAQKAILDAIAKGAAEAPRDAVAFRVDGYISAVGERTSTLVIYVWDVLDPSGRRIHRLSGQVNSLTGSERDAWEGVTNETIDELARRTISDLADWTSHS